MKKKIGEIGEEEVYLVYLRTHSGCGKFLIMILLPHWRAECQIQLFFLSGLLHGVNLYTLSVVLIKSYRDWYFSQ